MKDAYSFHTSQESLQETYDACMRPTAKSSAAWGWISAPYSRHRFYRRQRLSRIPGAGAEGEDDVVFSDTSDYAANIELAKLSRRKNRALLLPRK